MTRRNYLYLAAALIVMVIACTLALAVWAILLVPIMIYPKLLSRMPSPQTKIQEVIVKRSMKAMMSNVKM